MPTPFEEHYPSPVYESCDCVCPCCGAKYIGPVNVMLVNTRFAGHYSLLCPACHIIPAELRYRWAAAKASMVNGVHARRGRKAR
jgi:hypothetical protein